MTIGSISDLSAWVAQLGTSGSANRSTAADATGTNSGAVGCSPSAPPTGGGLVSAIMEALSQVGVSTDGSTTSSDSSSATSGTSGSKTSNTASDSDTQQALQSFMLNLFAALHAQSAGDPAQSGASSTDGASSATTVAVSGSRRNPASDLQSLIQQLAASESQSTSSATDWSSTASSTSDSTLTSLERSFQKLIAATGGTDGSQAALGSFLSALASDMSDASSVGNIVSTQA